MGVWVLVRRRAGQALPLRLPSTASYPRPSCRRTRGHHRDGGRACLSCGSVRRDDRREVSVQGIWEHGEVDGLSEGIGWCTCFAAAVEIAAVSWAVIAIVALLGTVEDTVSATGEGTVRAAAVGQRVIIQSSIVALFSQIQGIVSAEVALEPAVISAAIDQR